MVKCMPVGFSSSERERISLALQQQGHVLFATYGLKKTSVEELAHAAGISKGAFYLFYDSKEALFFTLLEQYEASFKAALLREIAQHDVPPPERMQRMLGRALVVWKQNALFTRFSRGEYEQLLRKLPPERINAHLAEDEHYAETFVAAWQAAGVALTVESQLVAGLIRALFFVSLHEEEFGDGVYAPVVDTLVSLLAQHFVAPQSGERV